MRAKTVEYTPSMSDDAVRAKSGKTWPEWFGALDSSGCSDKPHKEIVAVLRDQYDVGSWWQQMITVEYERARGLRQVHQKCDGDFSANATKTLGVSLESLYDAWADDGIRAKWMKENFTVRKATPLKSIRILWPDSTTVDIGFYPKDNGKAMVTVQHNKLADSAEVRSRKAFWKERLDGLANLLAP